MLSVGTAMLHAFFRFGKSKQAATPARKFEQVLVKKALQNNFEDSCKQDPIRVRNVALCSRKG